MNKKLEIKTVNVTIQLITVDNKKMTKSVFNQIQIEDFYDNTGCFIGDSVLGYVYSDLKYVLWTKKGELRKTNLYFLPKKRKNR